MQILQPEIEAGAMLGFLKLVELHNKGGCAVILAAD